MVDVVEDVLHEEPDWGLFLLQLFDHDRVEFLHLYREALLSFFKVNHAVSLNADVSRILTLLDYRIMVLEHSIVAPNEVELAPNEAVVQAAYELGFELQPPMELEVVVSPGAGAMETDDYLFVFPDASKLPVQHPSNVERSPTATATERPATSTPRVMTLVRRATPAHTPSHTPSYTPSRHAARQTPPQPTTSAHQPPTPTRASPATVRASPAGHFVSVTNGSFNIYFGRKTVLCGRSAVFSKYNKGKQTVDMLQWYAEWCLADQPGEVIDIV